MRVEQDDDGVSVTIAPVRRKGRALLTAGPPTPISKPTRTFPTAPDAHAARAVRRGLRRRQIAGAPDDGHRPRRPRLRPAHGAGRLPLEGAARIPRALPAGHHLPGDEAGAQRLLAVLRSHRCRRRVFLPCAGAERRHSGQLRFSRLAARCGRLRIPRRVRPHRVLGPADHARQRSTASGGCSSPATRATSTRRTAASG